ncbi:MAG: DUF6701 domain-containing protein [Pseudomonadales bacterium]
MRWVLLLFMMGSSSLVTAESCGTLESGYGVYSASELKVGSNVRINGNRVARDDFDAHGIEPGGAVAPATIAFPGLEPASFPRNSSNRKLDSGERNSLSSDTEVFYEEIKVERNDAFSFSGDGPFHIKELKVEQGATITLDAGTFYIGKFDIERSGRLIVNSSVRLHIDEELKIEQGFEFNAGNDPEKLVVFLYRGAKFEVKEDSEFSGVVYGDQNGDVKLEQGVDFTGSLLSDGKVEIARRVRLHLSSTQQTALASVSTCIGSGSGDGGVSSCDAIPADFAVHSASEVEVDDRVRINGNVIRKRDYGADTAINLNGSTLTDGFSLPEFDPASFPDNSSRTDLDEDDSPLDGADEIFLDDITVGNDRTFTFTGAGPFHIDRLRIRDRATVIFSAGTYFIDTLDAGNDSRITAEYPTRIHIKDEFDIGDRFRLNTAGDPQDLIVFLHSNAEFESGNDSRVTAVLLGDNNRRIRLRDRTNFTGMILSDGKVELKNDVTLNLSTTELSAIGMESTCENDGTSTGLSHFVITHDGAGIHCLPESFTVTAVNRDGDTITDFDEEITINTQTGRGTFTLLSGGGSFVDGITDDGLMAYRFAAIDQGVATFALNYQQGTSSFDLDAYLTTDSDTRDDDTEGNLLFQPTGFTVTQSALSNPPPATINDPVTAQVAGTSFNIHLTAYGESPTDGTCGVIESYSGNQNLAFWLDYDDPSTGTIVPTVAGQGIAVSEAAAVSQTVTFSSGQASVPVKYKDVGRIQIEMKDGAIRGATAPFVVRPADLVVTSIANSSGGANPGASSMTGARFVAAGVGFTVRAEVRDAEGSLTPNFGNEASAEGLVVSAATLVAPAGGFLGSGNDGNLGNGTDFVATSMAGRFENNSVSFDEVGIVQLQLGIADGSYLASGDVSGTLTSNVGRFAPASLSLVSSGVSGACGNRTYMGQPALGISYQLEARGVGFNVLRNYDSSLIGAGGVASLQMVAENANTGVNLASRLPSISSNWVNGVRSFASTIQTFSRLTIPDGPYQSLQLGLSLNDPVDGLELSGLDMNAATTGDCGSAGTCNARTIGSATEVFYGRLEVQNAFGSETSPLEVAVRTTVFNGGSYMVNGADSCTSYQASEVSLGNYQDGLPAVSVLSPSALTNLASGRSLTGQGLLLSSPGATNTGSVDVTLDAPSWLEYDWTGSGPQDPFGTAIFGQFRGHDKVIYWREVF